MVLEPAIVAVATLAIKPVAVTVPVPAMVADGTVVNLFDGVDEQVPGAVKPVSTEAIGGNMVVVDIGDGAFAFYAHLQRGSLKVKLGDRVKTGQVLGLLGNTGNSTAPRRSST